MSYTHLIISLPLLAWAAGCIAATGEPTDGSSTDGSASATARVAASEADVEGVWRTLCVTTAAGSVRREARFCDDSSYFAQYAYRDPYCHELGSAVEYEGSIESDYDTETGERELTQTLTRVQLTPLDRAAVESLEDTPACGGQVWEVGSSMEPTPCMSGLQAPPALHALYRVDGDTLHLSVGSGHAPLEVAVDQAAAPRSVPLADTNRYHRKPGPPGFCHGSDRDADRLDSGR
jgi:hypothetical protein